MSLKPLLAAAALGIASLGANAAEFKVGDPIEKNGMKLQVLYIQAVTMSSEPEDMVESVEGGKSKDAKKAMSDDKRGHDMSAMKDDKGGHDMSTMAGDQGGHGGHGGHGDHGGPADIHLEAAIHATEGNAWGFPEGAWVPYLNIRYTVVKSGSYFKARGRLIPMASNGGPHYGANIQLDGPGKYFVTYKVSPPLGSEFPYHTDKETGVNGWWSSFEIKDSFTYLGVGKKGGY